MTYTLTTAEIGAWEATGGVTKQIAAHLARKIMSGRLRAYAGLPSNESLAREWDTSERTATRAKKLLAGYGLVRKESGTYYVTSPRQARQGNDNPASP
jgi:DNA-binding GntR family transcriptional regulator